MYDYCRIKDMEKLLHFRLKGCGNRCIMTSIMYIYVEKLDEKEKCNKRKY